MTLLSVESLTVSTQAGAVLVDDVTFELDRGGRTGLIGESGSGKTLIALSIMGLLADGLGASGRVLIDGEDLIGRSDRALTAYRGNSMSMIFQEPMTAMNAVMRVGRQVGEPLRIHRGMTAEEADAHVVTLLTAVGIDQPERRARAYPHELSGGQRQRAMIAMALACGPSLVIADEPTTALDVTVQAQVLDVLAARLDTSNAALLLITHDLPVVAGITEDLLVIDDGRIVDRGPTRRLFDAPQHPYTARLVDAVAPMSRSGTIPPKDPPPPSDDVIITARGISRGYTLRRTRVGEPAPVIQAVDDVDLDIQRGETFGIVGESGSGKTTLARLLIGLNRPDSGSIVVDGIDLTTTRNLRPLRRLAQMVFQDPMGSLDPRLRVGDIISEPIRSLQIPGDRAARVAELIEAVALPADSADRYPHEFSGGQRQRIAIARALAPNPKILVADEPVSALDMSVQTVTLDLLAGLKADFDLTLIFISHDLSVVHRICDRVVVMQSGRVVDRGTADEVFRQPSTAYTRQLVDSIPRLDGTTPT
ncbi:MAG TPA: ABC transporter ATP-binding protein [Acidimicrobiia bacterium]|nr:ABC transporter ATP-binding protein [Acidimicrobiia bacterium]